MPPVNSTLIKSVDYNDGTKTMRVVFNNGQTYDYQNVPRSDYDNLLLADSVGQYFNQHIKKYSYEKVVG